MRGVLVTGGAGFIGSALVRGLAADSGIAPIRIADNLLSGRRENLAGLEEAIELHEADIRDGEALERLCAGVDTVFHLAAVPSVERSLREPLLCHEINLSGTLQVLEAARAAGVGRVVFASSSAVYGNAAGLPKKESSPVHPQSHYALQKLASEHYLRIYFETHGLETVSLRFFNVFGPRQDPSSPYSGVLSLFCRAANDGRSPTIHGDGEQTRDFVYVDDVARLLLLAARSAKAAGGVYNGGSGSRRSVNQIWSTLAEITGAEAAPCYAAAREGEVRHSQADISRSQRDLGFQPETEFEEGLRRTLEWMRGGE